MPDTPRIAVIVVNYNAGRFLLDCARSVLHSHAAVQLVVVDNASRDDSLARLREGAGEDPRLRIIVNPRNLGFAAGVNIGARAASAPVLVLLNPDCVVGPHTFERVLQAFEARADAGIAGGLVFNPDGSEQRGCRRREPTPASSFVKISGLDRLARHGTRLEGVDMTAEPLPGEAVSVDAVSGSFMAVRADVFARVGGMDEGYFLHCEDLDLCKRCRLSGFGVLFVPAASAVHHQGISGLDRPVWVEWQKHRGMARYFRKYQRERYGALARAAVYTGIYARFALKAAAAWLTPRRIRSRASPDAGDVIAVQRFAQTADASTVVLVGARSLVGEPLLRRLVAAGRRVIAVSRRGGAPARKGVAWVSMEYFSKAPAGDFPAAEALIYAAPIWTLPALLEVIAARGIKRIVALSSTSVLTKADSRDRGEAHLARELERGETALREFARHRGIDWTIFRPTLIYDGRSDANVARIRRFVQRFGVFPLIGAAAGLRQPLHADDLAAACVHALGAPATHGKLYTLNGGQTLSYRDMVGCVFASLGRRPRFVVVPPALMRAALRVLSVLPSQRDLTPSMAERMNRDLCFSSEEARRDFGFKPRPFAEALINA